LIVFYSKIIKNNETDMNKNQRRVDLKAFLELKEQLTQKDLIIKNLENQLEESGLIFNIILGGSLAGYWDWYIQDDYEYMSPTFKKMFGYEDDEFPNKPESWQKIIHPEDLKSIYQIFNNHVQSKGEILFNDEVRYYHKDGSIVWVYCRGQVIEWDKAGKPLRMVGCHVDITALKEAKKLTEQNELLGNENIELEQFAYLASHDLQEPLRTIKSFASLLVRKYSDKFDEEGKEYLDFIMEGAGRMADLIRSLLEHSRIGKGAVISKIDANKLLVLVQSDLDTLIKEKDAIIQSTTLPIIDAYSIEFELLLQNLIRNAIKFQKQDTQPVIKINAILKGNDWEFSVRDNGIGIPKDKLEDIFVIFRRLHLRSAYEGTGLGLAHCKKIIELHGGKVWVESTLGEGSCFYFTIPSNNSPCSFSEIINFAQI
jgi:two-component system CheB/CheR fusion protein